MIPDPYGAELRKPLREYINDRVETMRSGNYVQAIAHANVQHDQMVAMGKQYPNSFTVGLFMQSLNEMIDLQASLDGSEP